MPLSIIPEKIQREGGEGVVRIWNFHGYWRQHVEIPGTWGQLKKKRNFLGWWRKNHGRAVRSSPACIRKKWARQIQKNLKKIICYSCYQSSKAGKCHTFLVSFIIPISWPEWITSYFLTWFKIFFKMTHPTAQREAWLNTAPFFSKVGLRKFVLASKLCAQALFYMSFDS